MIVVDEWTYHPSGLPVYFDDKMFWAGLKACGFTPPKKVIKENLSRRAYWLYAMKRARSNHPHNARWKPLLELDVAMQVAWKLKG